MPGGWVQQAKLLADDAQNSDAFGFSVAILGETALVGALEGDGFATDSGCVYAFEREAGTWVKKGKLAGLDGQEDDEFGFSLSMSGERGLVGAPLHGWVFGTPGGSSPASYSGAAFVFERTASGWVKVDKLVPFDEEVFYATSFGETVSLHGDWALVSRPLEPWAFLFKRTPGGWVAKGKPAPSDADVYTQFGRSVSIHGDEFLIGAPHGPGGAVYAYTIPDGACAFRGGILGTNPPDYACLTEPHIAATWQATVATTPLSGTATAGTVLALGLGGAAEGVDAFGYELLALPPYLPLGISSTGSHSVVIPEDPTLVGATFATQAARIETSSAAVHVVLTNALDLSIGLF